VLDFLLEKHLSLMLGKELRLLLFEKVLLLFAGPVFSPLFVELLLALRSSLSPGVFHVRSFLAE